MKNGTIKKGDRIKFLATDKDYIAEEVGILQMTQVPTPTLSAGDVGYIITGIKISKEVKVGDTITLRDRPGEMLHGFEEVKPMVFAGIYPLDNDDFEDLRDSLEKLQLNDASLVYEPESFDGARFWFSLRLFGDAPP